MSQLVYSKYLFLKDKNYTLDSMGNQGFLYFRENWVSGSRYFCKCALRVMGSLNFLLEVPDCVGRPYYFDLVIFDEYLRLVLQ